MAVVLAVLAHPDDMEFVAAGTLLRLQRVGYEIHCLAVANGSCGSSDHGREEIVRVRRAEAEDACRLVGFARHESLVNDFEVLYESKTLARLAAVFRGVAPDILLTHSPSDYMEDHENACRLAVSAAFGRGMRNMTTDPPTPAVAGPVTVYHAQPHGNRDPLGAVVRPTHFVDVGGEVLERKAAMLARHRSQQQWLAESQGFASHLDTMRGLMREVGEWSGRFEHAEGWRRRLTSGFCAPDADPLVTALASFCHRTGQGVARAGRS
ncbi:MAG TPA: PIG-L family deacetylase [Vicinamibacteria bacterium]|nr:PIG-L family deacetylase [Vicinamibacteria bacterium]